MRYWYRRATGVLVKPVAGPQTRGHSDYDQTDDIADLPGPLACCTWNGTAVSVDAGLLADFKALLRQRIEDKAFIAVQETVLTTPWGDLRVRKDDIDAYQMIGFAAIYAIQTNNTTWSVNVRKVDDTTATLTAGQFVRLLSFIGDRMATKLSARDARLNQLAAATAYDLKGFEP